MTQTHEQTEAFPRSTMEILEQLRGVHAAALEKAIDALDALSDDEKIAKRYDKAEEKVAGCRELLRNIDLALAELRGMDVEHHVSEMKRHAEESGTQVTISAGDKSVTFGAGVDPITGEVDPTTACPDCNGVGRLEDRTGGGHHRCKNCDGSGRVSYEPPDSPVVVAVYPASNSFDENPIVTTVGQFTRYGELVADYGTACGIEVTMGEYQVVGEDDGKARDLGAGISPADHGKRLLVQHVDAAAAEEPAA